MNHKIKQFFTKNEGTTALYWMYAVYLTGVIIYQFTK